MNIKDISEEIHKNALEKGFWEDNNIHTKLLLIHTEISEAVEADRIDKHSDSNRVRELNRNWSHLFEQLPNEEVLNRIRLSYPDQYKFHCKDSFGAELAGATIRIFDLAKYLNIDLEAHMLAEHRFNLTRPYKHGKKY